MKLISLDANFEEFKSFHFKDGLNIIVADRLDDSTSTDSRNGLGKTTTLALIDFCLGANSSPIINQLKGRDWEFTLSIEVKNGSIFSVTRSPDHSELTLSGQNLPNSLTHLVKECSPGSYSITRTK